MMYNINTNRVPEYLQSVTHVTSVHTRNTQSAARRSLYTCNTNLKIH